MKQIAINTDVFAAIWACHQPGEHTEDDILRRVLKIPPVKSVVPAERIERVANLVRIGISDDRHDIKLPEGFEVFRVYKGVEYRAKAINESWLLETDGTTYPSINQVSTAVASGPENAWNNWYFTGLDGKRHLIAGLRKSAKPNVRHLAPLIP